MTTRDIEIKVDKDEKIKKINKEIKERHEKYISIVNDLEKGFDRTTGTYIYDKNAIDRRIREERDKYFDFYAKRQDKIIEIESDIYEDKKKEVKERVIVQKKVKSKSKLALNLAGIAIIGIGSAYLTTIVNHNNEVNRKTSNCLEELKPVIDKNTFGKLNTIVNQDGEDVEKVDKEKASPKQIQFVECVPISKLIENSNNPDLYFYTLYKNYGRTNKPAFYNICRKTFKYLEFEGSELGSDENIDKYLELNGYENLKSYYKACKKELYSDGDSELDNIKVKIKKMTK